MRVLMVEPGKHPYEMEIGNTLDAMYRVLDCNTITAAYPWKDPVGLVTDDEGLFREDHEWNRMIENGDVIRGNFFLCGLGSEDFTDLPPELMEKYKKRFWAPERFIMAPDGVIVLHMDDGTQPD